MEDVAAQCRCRRGTATHAGGSASPPGRRWAREGLDLHGFDRTWSVVASITLEIPPAPCIARSSQVRISVRAYISGTDLPR